MSKQALAVVLMVCLAYVVVPVSGTDKEILALEQNVTLLMGKVADLQTSMNSQSEVVKSLINSNTDTVNKMASAVGTVQQTVSGNETIADQRQTQISSSFQNLSDQMGNLKAEIDQENTILKQVQQLQQTISAPPPQPSAMAPATGADAGSGAGFGTGFGPTTTSGSGGAAATMPGAPAGAITPAQQAFKNALTDFTVGNSQQAQSEFAQYLRLYPEGDNVADALYYLGTVYYTKKDYQAAVEKYSEVLDEFPNSPNAPQAELNKGMSLAMMGNKSAAIAEFKSLIANYKDATEQVRLAKDELNHLQPKPVSH